MCYIRCFQSLYSNCKKQVSKANAIHCSKAATLVQTPPPEHKYPQLTMPATCHWSVIAFCCINGPPLSPWQESFGSDGFVSPAQICVAPSNIELAQACFTGMVTSRSSGEIDPVPSAFVVPQVHKLKTFKLKVLRRTNQMLQKIPTLLSSISIQY